MYAEAEVDNGVSPDPFEVAFIVGSCSLTVHAEIPKPRQPNTPDPGGGITHTKMGSLNPGPPVFVTSSAAET